MATAGSVSVPELVACVVGLSRAQGEEFTMRQGIGKSCLCYRFFHSNSDEYADDHQSLLALHEFTSPVINNVHFLYWGSDVKTFPCGKASEKSAQILFHVIEQTVFYQDETSKPFSISGSKPDSLEEYVRRITGSIESPGKLSYKSCNDIESHTEKQQYPPRISRLPRGFLVVLDVSLSGDEFESQCKRAEFVLDYLMKQKQKFVMAATKRDNCDEDSLERAHKIKRKYRTQLIETSASRDRNVYDAFRVLACKTLQKKAQGVNDSIPAYEEDKKDSVKPAVPVKRAADSGKKSAGGKERRRSKLFSLLKAERNEDTVCMFPSNGVGHHGRITPSYPEELEDPPKVGKGSVLEERDLDIVALSEDLKG